MIEAERDEEYQHKLFHELNTHINVAMMYSPWENIVNDLAGKQDAVRDCKHLYTFITTLDTNFDWKTSEYDAISRLYFGIHYYNNLYVNDAYKFCYQDPLINDCKQFFMQSIEHIKTNWRIDWDDLYLTVSNKNLIDDLAFWVELEPEIAARDKLQRQFKVF